jgi:hypothetical protein
MPLNTKTITYQLAAAVATGISTSASGTAGTSLLINGSLATGGVATLDSGGAARRVIVTSAGNDSSITFKITGTDRYGRSQSEVLTGANTAAAQSTKDYLTVTSIVPSGNTASTVTAGTNGVGSSDAYIVDWVPNGNLIGAAIEIATGKTVNCTVQESYDDLSPAWDQANNNVTWFNDTNLASKTANTAGTLAGPFTMIRLLINSGTDPATLKLITPFIGGRI